MRWTTDEITCAIDRLTPVVQISVECFEVEVDEEPSIIVDPALDDWGTTVRILPPDMFNISDGTPRDQIDEVRYSPLLRK